MRVILLGGNGMLGHQIWQTFHENFDTFILARKSFNHFSKYKIFDEKKWISGIDATNFEKISNIIESLNPDIIINCMGIVKQIPEAEDPILSISVNSLFPQKLALLASKMDSKVIHFSTDCVFSGFIGNYNESENPDPVDLYGRSKLLGEIYGKNCLTIRTSIIGHELDTHHGLLEWFLCSNGSQVQGYKNAIFSGLTTKALSQILLQTVYKYPSLSGLYHISSNPISKFDLLEKIKEAYKLSINITPYFDYKCNRSLDSSKFWKTTKFNQPSWDEMINGMVKSGNN